MWSAAEREEEERRVWSFGVEKEDDDGHGEVGSQLSSILLNIDFDSKRHHS